MTADELSRRGNLDGSQAIGTELASAEVSSGFATSNVRVRPPTDHLWFNDDVESRQLRREAPLVRLEDEGEAADLT
ncbi:unnamed protein product [Hydatigera taeniaeformis]|uniref:Uncharacterized protein n=1 Tax=Hydatigena taeniaeformis TaxID=6205 RepID=A0A0R3WQ82_HYDTA|nr:unnamed protein product [Hydatigera taeniaeformis]